MQPGGRRVDEAKEHGDDSFHFTNCSPQFWSFNQGKQLWAGLEDYTRDELLKRRGQGYRHERAVFDGPDADGGDLAGSRAALPYKDPIFGDVAIPKYFWKILISKGDNGLKAAAFMMSQRDLIMDIDRIQEADMLERLSAGRRQGLPGFDRRSDETDQARLRQSGARPIPMKRPTVGPRLIETYDDIRI